MYEQKMSDVDPEWRKKENKGDLKGVKVNDAISAKESKNLEKKIKALRESITKKSAPKACVQNPLLEDILKVRGIHGGVYKL